MIVDYDDWSEGDEPTPVIFCYTASWCGPCRQLKTMIEDIYDEVDEDFVIVDVEKHAAECRDVKGVPLLRMMLGDKVISERNNINRRQELKKWITDIM